MDPLDLYKRASDWTAEKVKGVAKGDLDVQTPCNEWKARDLINHLLEGNRYFTDAARGKQGALPQGQPTDLLSDDPLAQYKESRDAALAKFSEPGVVEKMGMQVGLMFVEQLVHGWDLAKATDQDTKMPGDLAEAAFKMMDGRMSDEQRGSFFGLAVKVADDASAQDKLLAYSGRTP